MTRPRLCYTVMTYDWCCIECKTCEVCMIKGDDVSGPLGIRIKLKESSTG